MNTRLKTSKNIEQKLNELHASLKFSSKAAVARIAIGLSLKDVNDPRTQLEHLVSDTSGFEFQRHTLTGDFDEIYKIMILQHINTEIDEDSYFPSLVNAHIERGINFLYSEYKMAGNREKLMIYLLGIE